MLPRNLIDADVVGPRIIPGYLTERDMPWLSTLLEVYDAHVGRSLGELEARLSEPLPIEAPPRALRMACHVLAQKRGSAVRSSIEPTLARLTAAKAMSRLGSRSLALQAAARECGCTPGEVESALIADVPSARILEPPRVPHSTESLRLEVNLALASGLLLRALCVKIRAKGHTRQLVRQAQLQGLIVDVVTTRSASRHGPIADHPASAPESLELRITGPLALFHHTLVYGRALASLVRRLGWCESFELRASCSLWRGPSHEQRGASGARHLHELVLGPRDPLPWCKEPVPYDSLLERRFARELRRLAPDWELRREPLPLVVGGHFAFPDFELTHRRAPDRRFMIEVAGYHTEEYLRTKLRLLNVKSTVPLLLCVDTSRSCSQALVPAMHPWVVTFERTLQPRTVLERLGILKPDAATAGRPSKPRSATNRAAASAAKRAGDGRTGV